MVIFNLRTFSSVLALTFVLFAQYSGARVVEELFHVVQVNPDSSLFTSDSPVYVRLNKEVLNKIVTEQPDSILLEIPLDRKGHSVVLSMRRGEVLKDESAVYLVDSEQRRKLDYLPGLHYRGQIQNEKPSIAAVSIYNDDVMGVFSSLTRKGNYNISRVQTDKSGTLFAVFSDFDRSDRNPIQCLTPDEVIASPTNRSSVQGGSSTYSQLQQCVKIHVDLDYYTYSNAFAGDSIRAINYVLGLYNQVIALYHAETVDVSLSEIVIWTAQDPWAGITSALAILSNYKNYWTANPFTGDLAQFISYRPFGEGWGYIGGLCSSNRFSVCTSLANYAPLPVYSWSVEVLAHEAGHNLGSRHTQWCGWPGGAIDNCATPETNCAFGPPPVNGGTIMSYCHNTSYGINFANGFGLLPGNAIRNFVANSPCLGSCQCQPSVQLNYSPNSPICSGTCVTFTATPVNGGATPLYTWYKNGVVVQGPSYSATYQSCNLTSGTRVYCEMTSNALCAFTSISTSNFVDVLVNNYVVPSLVITSPTNAICTGECINLNAVWTNGGTSPSFRWYINGVYAASGSPSFITCNLTNGQSITCQMTSNITCAVPATITSAPFVISVNPVVAPSISISANITRFCTGTTVSFVASGTNSGSLPNYSWVIVRNGTVVSTTNQLSPVFSTSSLQNGDVVYCQMTSNSSCASIPVVTSNSIQVQVNAAVSTPFNGLLAWYPFNGNGLDFSGNAFHGTFADLAYLGQDRFLASEMALGVSGNGEHLEVGNPAGFNDSLSHAITISAWIYKGANNSSQAAIVSKWNFDRVNDEFLLWLYHDKPNFAIGDGVMGVNGVQSQTVLQDSAWYHLVGTWDTTGMHEIYINGRLDTFGLTSTPVYRLNTVSAKSLNIGNETGFWRSFRGRIDEVRIYNRKLSLSEIQDLYFAPPNAAITITTEYTTVCAGSAIVFTSSAIGTGATPSYLWYIDRPGFGMINTGVASSSFTSTQLQDGDEVFCQMRSSDLCIAPSVVNSNRIRVNVLPGFQNVGSIFSDTVVCQGHPATVTASLNSANYSASFQWYLNQNPVLGSSSPVYSFYPNPGDVIHCEIVGLDNCVTPTVFGTNSLQFYTDTSTISSVEIQTFTNPICPGANSTFQAINQLGSGSSPNYIWFVNGMLVATSNVSSVTIPGLQDGDVVTCGMVSSLPCVSSDTAISNAIVMHVATSLQAGITLGYSPGQLCSGGSITVTAFPVNGGSSPVYQWFRNGVPAFGDLVTVTFDSIRSGDVIVCSILSSDSCVAPVPFIDSLLVNAISFTPIIYSNGVELCASTASDYQWFVNGSAIANTNTPCIQPLMNGYYSVTATGASGCTGTSVLFPFNGVGFIEQIGQPGTKLYPNPATDLATMEFSSTGQHKVELMDVQGRLIELIFEGTVDYAGRRVSFSTSSFSEGIYVLRITDYIGQHILRLAILHP